VASAAERFLQVGLVVGTRAEPGARVGGGAVVVLCVLSAVCLTRPQILALVTETLMESLVCEQGKLFG